MKRWILHILIAALTLGGFMATAVERKPSNYEMELAHAVAETRLDPLHYVLLVYPWGVENTPLAKYKEPRSWQCEFLERLGDCIKDRAFDGTQSVKPIETSVVSGHGIGKGAMSSWLAQFLSGTRPNSKGIMTANTGVQLFTRTWSEMHKWHNLNRTKLWYEMTADKYYRVGYKDTWFVVAQTWSKERSEAFAGLHAEDSSPFYINDEASAIDDDIFDVQLGGLVDGEGFRFNFGNGTRNSGYFRETQRKHRARHDILMNVDSRTVEGTNKEYLQQIVDDYGEDSDVAKVRVRGMFPKQDVDQFIGETAVDMATRNPVFEDRMAPFIIGVDVSRGGGCETVLAPRIGRDARSLEWTILNVADDPHKTQLIVREIIRQDMHYRQLGRPVDAWVIEGNGLGGPIADQLTAAGMKNVHVVDPGLRIKERYVNLRAKMYGDLKEWLPGGAIPDDQVLRDQLLSIHRYFDEHSKIGLESKEHMRLIRGVESPDRSDALALTFAVDVYSIAQQQEFEKQQGVEEGEYNPLEQWS